MFREVRDWIEELGCRAGIDRLPAFGGRLVWALVLLAAALWLWSGGHSLARDVEDPSVPAAHSRPEAATPDAVSQPSRAASVTVHVVGEVRHPGVYVLVGGCRASDAIDAAGGLLGAADEAAINLARVVMDGEQIAVPRMGRGASSAGGASAAVVSAAITGGRVDLNTAGESQLDSLPGVGPATAKKIVADRTANGPFRTVDDLMRVPGIGPAKFEALKDLVTAG